MYEFENVPNFIISHTHLQVRCFSAMGTPPYTCTDKSSASRNVIGPSNEAFHAYGKSQLFLNLVLLLNIILITSLRFPQASFSFFDLRT
jgi:hypothetical protein